MLRSKKKRSLEEDPAEFEGSELKKGRATTTPGTLRLIKDMEDLENNASIVLEQPDEPCRVTVEYRVDPGISGRCPNRFEVTAPKRYPHDAPLVRCIDKGYACRFIDETGTVIHSGLREDWTAICTLGSVVQILQSIRGLFLNLQDGSTTEPTDSSYLFGNPNHFKRKLGILGEGEDYDNSGEMLDVSHASKPKFDHYIDNGVQEKHDCDVDEFFDESAAEYHGGIESNEWASESIHGSQDSNAAMAIEEA